jgi:hypothetical protein
VDVVDKVDAVDRANHQSPFTSHPFTHSPSRRLYSFSRGFASLIVRSSSSASRSANESKAFVFICSCSHLEGAVRSLGVAVVSALGHDRSRSLSPVAFFKYGANKSIGIGKNVVVLCSLEISFIVCRNRSCRAIGCAEIISAACTSFSAA